MRPAWLLLPTSDQNPPLGAAAPANIEARRPSSTAALERSIARQSTPGAAR